MSTHVISPIKISVLIQRSDCLHFQWMVVGDHGRHGHLVPEPVMLVERHVLDCVIILHQPQMDCHVKVILSIQMEETDGERLP